MAKKQIYNGESTIKKAIWTKTILGIKSSCNLCRKVIIVDHFRKIKRNMTKKKNGSTALCRDGIY